MGLCERISPPDIGDNYKRSRYLRRILPEILRRICREAMGFWALLGLAVYFAPTFIAWGRKNFARIALLNVLLGWTVIGWIAALVWALRSPETESPDP